MRALVITKHGSPDVMKVQDRPEPPDPGPGEARVNVRAAGINFADLMARSGLYPEAPKPPCVVGYEFAGDVESVGEGVDDFAPGDRVLGGTRFGGYAEQVTVSVGELVPLPADWSYEEGAALPVNYATAYAGLVRYGNVAEGERVLVHAVAGGVGIAATQIAKLRGAEVFGTASGSKHDALRDFGVDHAIDYREQDFVKAVRAITGDEHPLDLVMDAVGGRSFGKSFSLLRPGGRLVCFGASSVQSGDKRSIPSALRMLATTGWFNPMRLMSQSKAVIGLNMLAMWDERRSLEEYMEPLRSWMADGSVRPVVAEAFPLERGPDAHRFMHERKNVGKVVLTL